MTPSGTLDRPGEPHVTPRGDDPTRIVVPRASGLWLAVLGVAGLAASFALTVDKFKILEDPSFQPACNINPVLSCGSVMSTDQADAFGFPNSLLGVIAFTAVVGLGLLMAARVDLPRWVYGGMVLGSTLGVVGVHWLAFESLYRIGALCPWCMVVWVATLPIGLWSVLLFARMVPGLSRVGDALWSVRFLLLFLWYLVFVTAALIEFWDYWRTLI